MNGAAKGAIVGGVFLAMVGGTAYGVYTLVGDEGSGGGGDAGGRTGASSSPAANTSGPITDKEAAATAKAFLAAWAAGDDRTAAELTNNTQAAQAAVAGYKAKAMVSKAVITPGTPDGATVPFKVEAEITYQGTTKPLAYDSRLTVVRGAGGVSGVSAGKPLVDWQPSVIHPELQRDETLRAGTPASPPVKAVDRHGKELTAEQYPSLRPVLDSLRKTYGEKTGGTPGAELWIEPAAQDAPRRSLLTLVEGKPGQIETVLDADVQAAAEKAVAGHAEASVVAVQPSTGDILAVANHRRDGFNAAMQGRRAPGSTMKIVTAAMLLEKGLVAADRPADCPATASWEGKVFHNLNNFTLQGQPFSTSFARSCNTAFISLIDDVKDNGALPRVAKEAFGIGLDWKTGIPSQDGSVPVTSGPAAAAEYIGQGAIQMNPLNVASITATARTGVFRQPVLVKASLDGRTLATAPRSLAPGVSSQLVRMMKQAATGNGTAAGAMSSVGGSDKGAKTGSAEVDNAAAPDSWFTGFSGDVAAAATVEGGGHGGDTAGPIVAAVLNAS
ncbi:penicillin-binding transpeptidase domain-containing protein [Streptomyces sp. NBC_00091]|uniref:penicillin-binding transpeptidase domain-containing protein n=1 Tax=Streptomyces sp. NBC_00091 TaxID=2975648 RepID=UPI00225BDB60|nr:penicillin-binding transpeptidase domain-containing protein [Streptomyces sp. NBC_00091]MCX5377906.1 penicillin-binding transpeptidase domain-containing protein [Streptomyces sp. NBC_00091]